MSDDPAQPAPQAHIPTVEDFPETGANALGAFGQRAWARIADTVIIFLPLVFIASAITIASAPGGVIDTSEPVETPAWVAFAWVGLATAYEVIAVAVWGKTVGKVALGMRIARFVDGANPSWGQAFLRALLPMTAAVVVTMLLGLEVMGAAIVYVSALASPLGRGWHDQAGGTVVIRTR